jgi:hypothetical protein
VVTSFDDDLVGSKVRTREEAESLDEVRLFGSTTREGDDGEFLIRGKSDEFGATNDASLLGFEVVDLDEVVVGNVDGDDLVLATRRLSGLVVSGFEVLCVAVTSQEIFNQGGKFLVPEFLVFVQENSRADVSTDLTGGDVSDVDTFVLVKRNSLSAIEDLDFDGRNVGDRSSDHPAVTSSALGGTIVEGSSSVENQTFILSKDEFVLDAGFERCGGVEEEGADTLAEFLGAIFALALDDGVEDDAVLTLGQGGESDGLVDDLLVRSGHEGGAHLNSDEPFFTSLAGLTEAISEVASCGRWILRCHG